MQTIHAKVQVGTDRTLQVQLPNDVPAGEYEIVLVLHEAAPTSHEQPLTAIQRVRDFLAESTETDHSLANDLISDRREENRREENNDKADLATRWQQWFEELDQLPMPEEREVPSFQQHLIEKYRQQGLDL